MRFGESIGDISIIAKLSIISISLDDITMVAYIIKIEDLPTFSGEKTDMLIGFSVVGLAKNTLWVVNLSNF